MKIIVSKTLKFANMADVSLKYPRDEKLKRKSTIDLLFSKGKSVAKYPLRLVFVEISAGEEIQNKTGVSVSKKYFKKAVDRNYYKRVLRETYRHNKGILQVDPSKSFGFMLLYQTKDRLPFDKINTLTVELFQKFASQMSTTK